ncbi:MAG: hypothetical protein QOD68_1174, partial [Actinomycetota bacterium]|nr:hypothetical protein [Actinomycetota bacterium]
MRQGQRTVHSLLAAVMAGALLVTLGPAAPAGATSYTVDKRFFGVHKLNTTSWPV